MGGGRGPGGPRGLLLLDVRLSDALGPALGVLLTPDAGMGTSGGRAPCARRAPRAAGPGLDARDDRLGRPRRRGMVVRCLRPADTLPGSGCAHPGGRHRSDAGRRHPSSRCRAGAPARSVPPAVHRCRLLHLVSLALAGARACTSCLGAQSGPCGERGRLRVQSRGCSSDHRPPGAADPALTVALDSHGAQPRGRRRARVSAPRWRLW